MEDLTWWWHLQIRCLHIRDIILECHLLCILRLQRWAISGFLRHFIILGLPSVVFLKEWFHQILNYITQWLMVLILPTLPQDLIWIPFILPHSNSTLQDTRTSLLYPGFLAWMKVKQTMWHKMRKRNRKLINSNRLYNMVAMSNISFRNLIILLYQAGPTCNLSISTLIWCTTKW